MARIDPAFLVPWVRAELEALGDAAVLDAHAAAAPLWLAEVREARGLSERIERSGPSCVAWLRATPGAAQRLARLVAVLVADPRAAVAELAGLGGTPGCATR